MVTYNACSPHLVSSQGGETRGGEWNWVSFLEDETCQVRKCFNLSTLYFCNIGRLMSVLIHLYSILYLYVQLLIHSYTVLLSVFGCSVSIVNELISPLDEISLLLHLYCNASLQYFWCRLVVVTILLFKHQNIMFFFY